MNMLRNNNILRILATGALIVGPSLAFGDGNGTAGVKDAKVERYAAQAGVWCPALEATIPQNLFSQMDCSEQDVARSAVAGERITNRARGGLFGIFPAHEPRGGSEPQGESDTSTFVSSSDPTSDSGSPSDPNAPPDSGSPSDPNTPSDSGSPSDPEPPANDKKRERKNKPDVSKDNHKDKNDGSRSKKKDRHKAQKNRLAKNDRKTKNKRKAKGGSKGD